MLNQKNTQKMHIFNDTSGNNLVPMDNKPMKQTLPDVKFNFKHILIPVYFLQDQPLKIYIPILLTLEIHPKIQGAFKNGG